MNSDEIMISWQKGQQQQQQQADTQQSSKSSTPSLMSQTQPQSPTSQNKNSTISLVQATATVTVIATTSPPLSNNEDSSSSPLNQSPTNSNCANSNNNTFNTNNNITSLMQCSVPKEESNGDLMTSAVEDRSSSIPSLSLPASTKNTLDNSFSIDDAKTASDFNPNCAEVYYQQGKAKIALGNYLDAFKVYSCGLTKAPNNTDLLEALVQDVLASNFVEGFDTNYNTLKKRNYDKKAFLVVAVLGQQLLKTSKEHWRDAVKILEYALEIENNDSNNNSINTNNDENCNYIKFKGSILSSIAYAYCIDNDYEKALIYMQKEVDIEIDPPGRCRVYSNIGHTYYKLGKFDKSLENHRMELDLAIRNNLYKQASVALNVLGHVHAARNDFSSALTSHTRCLEVLKQLTPYVDYNQCKELISIGHIHSMLGDYRLAEEKYNEAIQCLRSSQKITKEECYTGLCLANFNLAYLALKKQSLSESNNYYLSVIDLARKMATNCTIASDDTVQTSITPDFNNKSLETKALLYEMRALNGRGQALRLFKNFTEAGECFQRQKEIAKKLKDKAAENHAISNLATCMT